MKASAFSDAQKAFTLKQGTDGVPVAEICRRAGISPATYFNWKKKYDGLLPTEMKRLKQLEDENGRLVSGVFRRFHPVRFVHAVSRDGRQPSASTDQVVSALDFSSAILDWQRVATVSRSVRARAISHSRSSTEASYWSL